MTDQNQGTSSEKITTTPKTNESLSNFLDQLKIWGNTFSEIFISLQAPNESEVFRVLDIKRRFELLEENEKKYFDIYVDTFRFELVSGVLTIPMLYTAYKYRTENMKAVKDMTKINRYAKGLFFLGIPSVNLFIFSIYRRYFFKSSYEDILRLKYMKEIREMRKDSAATSKKDNITKD